jgi:hypothetical protein
MARPYVRGGMSTTTKPQPAPAEEKKRIELPVFGGAGGVLPGVDLSNNASLLEIMERDRDLERRKHFAVRTPKRRR